MSKNLITRQANKSECIFAFEEHCRWQLSRRLLRKGKFLYGEERKERKKEAMAIFWCSLKSSSLLPHFLICMISFRVKFGTPLRNYAGWRKKLKCVTNCTTLNAITKLKFIRVFFYLI